MRVLTADYYIFFCVAFAGGDREIPIVIIQTVIHIDIVKLTAHFGLGVFVILDTSRHHMYADSNVVSIYNYL